MKNKGFYIHVDYKYILNFLSLEEKGILLDCLIAYSENGQLPMPQSKAVDNAFDYIKNRLDDYEKKQNETHNTRSEAGKRGAMSRWGDSTGIAKDSKDIAKNGKCHNLPLESMAKDSKPIANDNKDMADDSYNRIEYNELKKEDNSDELSSKETNAAKVDKLMASMEQFALFWRTFPSKRKGNMEKARKAYERAIREKRATPEQIQATCEAYAKSDEVKKGFAKGCAAWLNDDRFNVDYSATDSQSTQGKSNSVLKDFINLTGGTNG